MAVAMRIAIAALLVAGAAGCSDDTDVEHATAGLAFTRYASAERPSVWVANADGSRARRVANDAYSPRLSRDGRRLAYLVRARDPNDLPTLFVRDLPGGGPRRVAPAFAYEWSPDGRHIAVRTPSSLLLFDALRGSTRIVERRRVLGGVAFDPTGAALAYSRWNGRAGRAYRSDIFVVPLRGRRVTPLTTDGHSDAPVWGGRRIVYRRFHFAGEWPIGRLRVMAADGSGDAPLARGDERTSLAHLGLDPLELSDDGSLLLACAAAEFSCAPVTLVVPQGIGTSFEPTLHALVHRAELAQAADLARDGGAVLFSVGPFDSPVGGRVYASNFDGGEPRLLVRNATDPSWAR